jgi:zinc protease
VIRERRGMNYGDYSYIEAFPLGYTTQVPPVNAARRSHLFEIWIRPISSTGPGTLHDRTLFATRAAWRELDKIITGGMTEETFRTTQQFLRNYTVNWATTISRRLAYAVDDAFYGIGGDGFLASVRPGLEHLTAADVNTAIRRHLQTDNMYLVFITADAQAFRRKLLSGAATPITYAAPKPELAAEDAEIASYPIRVKAENITIVGINEVFQRAR